MNTGGNGGEASLLRKRPRLRVDVFAFAEQGRWQADSLLERRLPVLGWQSAGTALIAEPDARCPAYQQSFARPVLHHYKLLERETDLDCVLL